jgi:hypothetical protein
MTDYQVFIENGIPTAINGIGERVSESTDATTIIQTTINRLASGDTMTFNGGAYKLSKKLTVQNKSNNVILGTPPATFTGCGWHFINCSNLRIENLNIINAANVGILFYPGKSPSNILINACSSTNSAGMGFMFYGGATTEKTFSNVTLHKCTALNSGRYTRTSEWSVGFDLCESCNMENVRVSCCYAAGSWESGFHMEYAPIKKNIVYYRCVSEENGMKQREGKEEVVYGAGYLCSEGATYEKCIAKNEYYGFRQGPTSGTIIDCVG